MNLAGPAQCVPEDEEQPSPPTNLNATASGDAGSNSAAVLDGGVDYIGPLQLWDTIMKKHKVAQLCTQELARLHRMGDQSDQTLILKERAIAVSTAVEALSKLHNEAVHKKLQAIATQDALGEPVQMVIANKTFLSNRDPLFWHSCFVRLFPRGGLC